MVPAHSTQEKPDEKEIFLKELRGLTGPSHKQLEEIPLSQLIVSPSITLEDYGAYLANMHGFISVFEENLFPLLRTFLPDLELRRKIHLLERDLRFVEAKINKKFSLVKGDLSTEVSPAFALGSLYVVEGSTLGGKTIYRNISAQLSLDGENGASYFFGYGAETGKRWTEFLTVLCSYGLQPGNKQEIFKGADESFKKIYEILKR